MDLIVETDLGRDPDDFFALCYLVSAGVNIRAITVSPGDLDQVAVAKFFLKEVGLDIPVGVGVKDRVKNSVGGMHTKLLQKYKFPTHMPADGFGPTVIKETMEKYPDCNVFACGPLHSLGEYVAEGHAIGQVTMQGGFCGYHQSGANEIEELDKFKGLTTCSTFNLGGHKIGALALMNNTAISKKRFIGKNLCHTIIYDKEVHKIICAVDAKDRAGELLREGMGIYLDKHKEKKFHDPTAAVCMLHPEIAGWVHGIPYFDRGKWGTDTATTQDSMVAVNIDKDKLWKHIAEGN